MDELYMPLSNCNNGPILPVNIGYNPVIIFKLGVGLFMTLYYASRVKAKKVLSSSEK